MRNGKKTGYIISYVISCYQWPWVDGCTWLYTTSDLDAGRYYKLIGRIKIHQNPMDIYHCRYLRGMAAYITVMYMLALSKLAYYENPACDAWEQ